MIAHDLVLSHELAARRNFGTLKQTEPEYLRVLTRLFGFMSQLEGSQTNLGRLGVDALEDVETRLEVANGVFETAALLVCLGQIGVYLEQLWPSIHDRGVLKRSLQMLDRRLGVTSFHFDTTEGRFDATAG